MKIPTRLYKYQTYSSYALECLVQKKIWISKPSDFNDPFDCKVRLEKITKKEQVEVLYKAADDLWNKQQIIGKQQLSFHIADDMEEEEYITQLRINAKLALHTLLNIGVYSMAAKKKDLLMWAHYADQHRGFILGYDATKFVNNDYIQLMKVNYNDEYVELTVKSVTNIEDLQKHLRTIASQKGKQWKREKEWRLALPFPRYNCLIDMPMPPVEMIFGHRMPDPQRETLHSLMSMYYDGIKFFTAKPSASKFELECIHYEIE